MKGIIVNIYKPDYDSTNKGVSSKATQAYLVGEGVPEIFDVGDDKPVFVLIERNLFGRVVVHAQPIGKPQDRNAVGPMFGGNFLYSSDSRFRDRVNEYPIPIHDRFETKEQYEALSR